MSVEYEPSTPDGPTRARPFNPKTDLGLFRTTADPNPRVVLNQRGERVLNPHYAATQGQRSGPSDFDKALMARNPAFQAVLLSPHVPEESKPEPSIDEQLGKLFSERGL